MRKMLMVGAIALLQTAICTAASVPRLIEMPVARFAIGDDPSRALPEFDDRSWVELSTLKNYEKQGFPDYDGYSWYRFHVNIPSSLKSTVRWGQRLRVYLSSVDDVDETFLNGAKIGSMGQMPEDPRGYSTRWNALREYFVDLSTGLVHWDQDNVIAVRVYDGSGGGGFYRDMPTLSLSEIVDGLALDLGKTRFVYGASGVKASIHWSNSFPVDLEGKLAYTIYDAATDRTLRKGVRPFSVAAGGSSDFAIDTPQRAGVEVRFSFTETSTGTVHEEVLHVPYLVTPAESKAPRINGAMALGAHPGSPIYYRVAVTGLQPLELGIEGLPAGLAFDAKQGVISGSVGVAGDYALRLHAHNRFGDSHRTLLLRVGDTLALTPPMGWNSWNAYGLRVDDARVRGIADALLGSGLASHGWTYINIDDGWESATRDQDGKIHSNEKFPDLPALSAYLHSRGLRFGIYSSPGPTTCGQFLGSLGHERQDADTYAQWGVDYLKYDLCSYESSMPKSPTLADEQAPYRLMAAALAAQPRDIVFSLCQYGRAEVWKWGADVGGNSWRTTGDIEDSWSSLKEIIDSQEKSPPYAKIGHWNDPDMLVVGEVGWGGDLHPSRLTPDEQYTHLSLWSLLAAPLLLGNELTHLDAFTRNLLANDEVIAIDQDVLGRAAHKVWSGDGFEIWARELADGRNAVGVFNFGPRYSRLALADRVSELPDGAMLRDVWRQQDLGKLAKGRSFGIPSHGVLLLTVTAPH
jgi:alpha-galactosidase